MADNVIPFDKYLRARNERRAPSTTELPTPQFQALAFLQLCDAGFLPRDQLTKVAEYLPFPALVLLKGMLRDR